MHELALAEAVWRAAEQAAVQEGLTTVTAIVVGLGELQHIKTDTFRFCLDEVRPGAGPRFDGAEVRLEVEPARFSCERCQKSLILAEAERLEGNDSEAVHFIPELVHAFITCPECKSADFRVTAGRGVTVRSMEGQDA